MQGPTRVGVGWGDSSWPHTVQSHLHRIPEMVNWANGDYFKWLPGVREWDSEGDKKPTQVQKYLVVRKQPVYLRTKIT